VISAQPVLLKELQVMEAQESSWEFVGIEQLSSVMETRQNVKTKTKTSQWRI